ncbi:hypothetical protein ACFYW6_34050 [Streptomyces sp. NPDC002659]|uniref:hypothetical protein n=1 Tax=Streptomyces sp. NPDC002659 TaxID=3364656 RepID=UPI00367A017B
MAKETEASRPLQYFPVDIGRYRHHDDLDTTAEVEGVAELLAPFGAEADAWEIDEDHERSADAVDERLRAWTEPQAPGDTFLYWVGHGESDGQSALLAHALSPRPLTAGGLTPEAIVQYLTTRQAHRHASGNWAIVVIDACRSARFVQLMSAKAHSDSSGGPRNVLLVSTSEDGAANLGQFRRALSTALTVNFPAEDSIDLWALGRELGRNMQGCPVIPHSIDRDAALHRKVPALAGSFTAPLDLLAEIEAVLATFTDDERRHFVPKASGAELGEQTWYFEGRDRERHQVLTWLNTARSGLLVVTGAAGSGKSALLGHVLVHTRPELSRLLEYAGHLAPLPASTPRPREAFDAVLHLTGTTPQDLVARIATAADLGTPPTDPSPTVQTDWLYERMRRRRKPFTFLADALDEAQLPLITAEHILRRLAGLPHVRVVVGTRRSTSEGPDLPQPDDQNLLDALGAGTTAEATVISVGRDREAVTRYVRRRLGAASATTYLAAALQVDGLAQAIGSLDREFLYARLAVHEITQSPALFGALIGLDELLESDHRQLFARAVDRLTARAPANRPLLEALALAQGRGLPLRDGIWAAAATAISDGVTISDADIEALTQAAAPYLMLDTEFGLSVYRLAHRTFAEHFAPSTPDDHHHSLITARLAADANDRLPSTPLNPYLVRYLPAHAALGGPAAWQQLAQHTRVLDRLDPAAVTASVMLQGFGRFELPPAIASVVGSQHQLATASPHERRGIRELATTRYTNQFMPAGPDPAGDDPLPTWSVRWARMQRHNLHLTLAGHTGRVNTVVGFTGPLGRTLLATSGDDGRVRIWDPATGTQTTVLRGHTSRVNAVVGFNGPGGRTLLATAGDDGTVRIWDPATGKQNGALTGHTGRVNTVVGFTGPLGRTLLATGSFDETVWIWDPATGKLTAILPCCTGEVRTLAAFSGQAGRPLLATASSDDTVRIWDPATGTQTATLVGQAEVRWVTTFSGQAGRPLLATGGDDTVRIWDPVTGTQTTVLRGHTSGVNAITAFNGPGGRTLLATAGDDGTVRIWDPATGKQNGALTGHTGRANTVVGFNGPGGRTLLAAGGTDGTVRIWDPATAIQTAPLAGHTGRVNTVAAFSGPAGRPLLASGGDDWRVRIWDPATGTQTGALVGEVRWVTTFPGPHGHPLLAVGGGRYNPDVRIWDPVTGTQTMALRGHTSGVNAITAFNGPDGRLLATAGDDGSVRIWDPATGHRTRTNTLTGHTRGVNAITAFNGPGGRTLLASGGDGSVRIWDPATAIQTGALTGHTRGVNAVVGFTGPLGRSLLASGGDDGTVRIWDPATGTQTATLAGHMGRVNAVVGFTGPLGRSLLASGGDDGTVRIWDPAADSSSLVLSIGIGVHDVVPIGKELALATAEGVVVISLEAAAWEEHLHAGFRGSLRIPCPASRVRTGRLERLVRSLFGRPVRSRRY